jgi:uncharacterized protein (TIGR00369 family)
MSDMLYRRVEDAETVITELMVPSYANFGGKVHGGILLSLMDKVAYVCATRHCRAYCVTVAVEGVEFLHPVDVGDLLTIRASVNYTGNTTMIVGMRVEAQHPRTGQIRHTNSSFFTMQAKGEDGKGVRVPGLLLVNEQQLRRFCEGRYLRQVSMERRAHMKSDLEGTSEKIMRDQCHGENCRIDY